MMIRTSFRWRDIYGINIPEIYSETIYKPVNFAARAIGVRHFAVAKRIKRNTIEHVVVDGYPMISEIVIEYELARKKKTVNNGIDIVEVTFTIPKEVNSAFAGRQMIKSFPLNSQALTDTMKFAKAGKWEVKKYHPIPWNKKVTPEQFYTTKTHIIKVTTLNYLKWYALRWNSTKVEGFIPKILNQQNEEIKYFVIVQDYNFTEFYHAQVQIMNLDELISKLKQDTLKTLNLYSFGKGWQSNTTII